MADVIYALSQKKAKLVARKRQLQEEFNVRVKQVNDEIENIDAALTTLNRAISDYLCPDCKGAGNIRICDAAGQMEDDTCPRCHGTGVSI